MSPLEILKFLYDMVVYVVLLRFLLQLVRADFFNPLSQFVVKVTQPVLTPLRRVIPSVGGIDLSSLLLYLLLVALGMFLFGGGRSLLGIALMLPFEATVMVINLFIFLIFVSVLLSWVDPYRQQAIQKPLTQLTEPIVRPIRRLVPPIGGFDLSPIFAFLVLNLLKWIVYQAQFAFLSAL